MTKIEEIYAAVLPEMKAKGIEDTIENRLAFLNGLSDAWIEDEDRSPEKCLYIVAISCEITSLNAKVFHKNLG